MPDTSAESEIGPEGLLSLEGRILLFLYREGSYAGTKSEFAEVIGSSPSRVHQELERLDQEGLVLSPPKVQGFQLTQGGRVRIRQFVVPRGLILVSLVMSAFVLVEGSFTVFLGWPAPSAFGLLLVGVIFLVYSVVLVRYYLVTEERILKGKSRSTK